MEGLNNDLSKLNTIGIKVPKPCYKVTQKTVGPPNDNTTNNS